MTIYVVNFQSFITSDTSKYKYLTFLSQLNFTQKKQKKCRITATKSKNLLHMSNYNIFSLLLIITNYHEFLVSKAYPMLVLKYPLALQTLPY